MAYQQINMIVNIIEKNDTKIRTERTDIENQLIDQEKNFNKELKEVDDDVQGFEKNSNVRQAKDYS